MADVDIDKEAALAACDRWNEANSKFDSGPFATMKGNPFNALTTPENIASSYINEVIKSMEEILTFSVKSYNDASKYVNNIDDKEQPPSPIPDPDPNPDPTPPSPTPDPDPDSNPDPTPTPPTPPVVPPTTVTEGIDISSLEKLNLKDIDGVVQTLRDMAKNKGKGIDEILADTSFADELKKLLLASVYIPDELKTILTNADSQIIRETFKSIMKGENPEIFDINTLNLSIVYAHLTDIANKNGITVEQLLNDSKYSELLKTSLSGFENVVELFKDWSDLSAEECQSKLLKLYDGDGIDGVAVNAVSVVRTFAETISEETKIVVEELLTDTKYAEVLKQGVEELGKTCVFVEATSHYTEQGMRETVSNLFNGKNYKAFGMDSNDVTAFKAEMDSLAKSNSVSVDNLLSDSKYADTVRDALSNSKNAEGVGSIFKNSESSVSQNVAKNLYSTKLDNGTTAGIEKNLYWDTVQIYGI